MSLMRSCDFCAGNPNHEMQCNAMHRNLAQRTGGFHRVPFRSFPYVSPLFCRVVSFLLGLCLPVAVCCWLVAVWWAVFPCACRDSSLAHRCYSHRPVSQTRTHTCTSTVGRPPTATRLREGHSSFAAVHTTHPCARPHAMSLVKKLIVVMAVLALANIAMGEHT